MRYLQKKSKKIVILKRFFLFFKKKTNYVACTLGFATLDGTQKP